MLPGATRRGSPTGCKTGSRRTGRGYRIDRDRGVYAQRGDGLSGLHGRHAQRKRDLFHPLGERVVQGGVLQFEQRDVLELPDTEQHTPSNALSAIGTNNANYNSGSPSNPVFTDPTNLLTPVGEFASCPGPYGTYDMGGDVSQWTEGTLENMCHNFAAWGFSVPSALLWPVGRGKFSGVATASGSVWPGLRALHHRTLARLCRLPVRFRLATATRKNWPSAVELIAAGFPVLSAGRSMARPTQPEPVA